MTFLERKERRKKEKIQIQSHDFLGGEEEEKAPNPKSRLLEREEIRKEEEEEEEKAPSPKLRFLEREERRRKKQRNNNWVVAVVWGTPNYEQEFVADLGVSNLFVGFWKRWELWELLLVGRGRRASW
jgi:hypothetical protein